jgi:hypothetical protein
MFSIINGKRLNESARSVENIVGFACSRTITDIAKELEQISRSIQNNIARGQHWHTNILKPDLSPEDAKYYGALYAEIFMEEMSYCNNTIKFIQFIAARYFEEEVLDKRNMEEDGEDGTDGDNIAETLPTTKQDVPYVSTKLADDLFVGSNLINRAFIEFIGKLGSMFSQQTITAKLTQPGCKIALFERFSVSIVDACSNKPSATHGQFIGDFTELFKICQQAWRMMSVFAFSNLFRFMEGSSYIQNPISADDSIFANHGTPLKFDDEKPPTQMFKLDI